MRFAFFPAHVSEVWRLPRKGDARSYEVLHLSRKIISTNLKIWCSKLQPLSGNQRPDLLTALMNMSLVQRLPWKMHLCRSSSNFVPRLPSFLDMWQHPHVLLTFEKVHNPLRLPRETTSERPKVVRTWCVFNILTSKCVSSYNRVRFFDITTSKSGPNVVCFVHFWVGNVLRATMACTFSTSQLPKVDRTWCALCILTWKCASRHNRMHFFIISTPKSGPNLDLVCVVHFDFEMCFAPQPRALLRHHNFQKWSKHDVFCAFWLGNVLRATRACTFSTSERPKVVRTWCVLYILTSKCASRHEGVQLFISHLGQLAPHPPL